MSENYLAALGEATKLNWPISFPRDLTEHDRCEFERYPDKTGWLWAINADGTHLFRLNGIDRNWLRDGRKLTAREFAAAVNETWRGAYRFFIIRRGVAREVNLGGT